jgi:hypothetical protein
MRAQIAEIKGASVLHDAMPFGLADPDADLEGCAA